MSKYEYEYDENVKLLIYHLTAQSLCSRSPCLILWTY